MSKSISIQNLSKSYELGLTHARSIRELVNGAGRRVFGSTQKTERETFWALKDISFDVNQGEVVGIIGKNGAGKSTLLKILSQITKPTSGRAVLKGRVASLLEVGTGFHQELTGRENVFLNGTILGMTKKEVAQRFDQIVDFAGIEKFIDTPVKRYSSGMTVRLGFAVAAHLDPEILIVDEVLAVGDVEFQKRCLSKMQDVAKTGRTVLFVSHNLASVRTLTNRSVVLESGTLAFDGPTNLAIEEYVNDGGFKNVYVIEKDQFSDHDSPLVIKELRFPSTATFSSNEPIRFEVDCLTREPRIDVNVSMTLSTLDGTPIGSCFSNSQIELTEQGYHSLGLSWDEHCLAPGKYKLHVSVIGGDNETSIRRYSTVTDVLQFEVLPLTNSTSTIIKWSPHWGSVRFPKLNLRGIEKKPGDSDQTFTIETDAQ